MLHDKVLHDLHHRVKNAHIYKAGDLLMYIMDNGSLEPVIVEQVLNHMKAYRVSSATYHNATNMLAFEERLRPMIRSKREMKQLLRVI